MERALSPAESLLSVASHIPGHASGAINSRNNLNNAHRSSNGASGSTKRRPAAQHANATATVDSSSLLDNVMSRKEHHDMAPSSSTSHPSLPHADSAGHANNYDRGGSASRSGGHQNGKTGKGGGDWAAAVPPTHLEGPGMPPPRGSTQSSLSATVLSALDGSPPPTTGSTAMVDVGADAADGEGDGEGENDERTYCFCKNVSYGQMIACDDDNCENEWVSSQIRVLDISIGACAHEHLSPSIIVPLGLHWSNCLSGRGVVLRYVPCQTHKQAEFAGWQKADRGTGRRALGWRRLRETPMYVNLTSPVLSYHLLVLCTWSFHIFVTINLFL